jgi:uncharacterized protein YprB with RNaseH-like and TPR domain
LFNQHIGLNQIVKPGGVICFAAKWHGEKKVEFRSDLHDGHDEMIRRARALCDEADATITYNGKGFDNKHLRREWVLAGLDPASPHVDIDLLSVVRKQFRFASSKLDHVARELGLGAKVKHSGFEMWPACMAGDAKAWKMMRLYNIHDVRLTEALYDRLLPWVSPHPHRGLYGHERAGCPKCSSMQVIVRGYRRTKTGRYQQFQCNDCRSYFSGTHRVEAVHHIAI